MLTFGLLFLFVFSVIISAGLVREVWLEGEGYLSDYLLAAFWLPVGVFLIVWDGVKSLGRFGGDSR